LSALTKIFVVLLVILANITVAALVVFVNRQENFKQQNDGLTKALAAKTSEAALARADNEAIKSTDQQQLNARDATITAQREALAAAQTNLGAVNGQMADLTSKLNMALSSQTTLAAALQVAQQQNATSDTNFAAVRKQLDGLQAQYTEASLHITDLQNKLDVTEKQRIYLSEQVAQLTAQNAQQADVIHKNLPAIESRQGVIVNPTPMIALDGVIRDKTVIAGVPYATISLGSAEQVQKNMQFKVIDGDKFLGYLTVDTVEPHESTGRLEGPHIDDVHSGVEVKTQL
jgi:hypothetical protein